MLTSRLLFSVPWQIKDIMGFLVEQIFFKAVVIRQVVLVLFLPIFHGAFRLLCLCLAIATVFQVWSTLEPEY